METISWADLFRALALVCILEGLPQALVPEYYRRMMAIGSKLHLRTLRLIGTAAAIVGLLILSAVPRP